MNLAVNARDAMPNGGQLTIRLSSLTLSSVLRRPPGFAAGRLRDAARDRHRRGHERGDPRPASSSRSSRPRSRARAPASAWRPCYGIVKQSGGRILCESAPGRGTTFSIYLPQVMGRTPEPARVESTAPLPRRNRHHPGGGGRGGRARAGHPHSAGPAVMSCWKRKMGSTR